MKKHSFKPSTYFKLIAILLIPAIFLIWYSFYDKEIGPEDFALQKTDIAGHFRTESLPEPGQELFAESDVQPKQNPIIYDTLPKRILFFGDSMLEGLNRRMKQYTAQNGHELLTVIWYSSSTKVWAEHIDTLKYFMKQFKPDYIVMCMGGNELFVRDLNKREDYIKTILQTVGKIPYVWIGPPNWKADTGINDLIEKYARNERYFPSKRLKYQRGKDGAHPTYASASMWMDSVACWMNDSIRHRILMKTPTGSAQSGKTVILQPLK